MHRLTSDFEDLARISTTSSANTVSDLYEKLADKLIMRLVQEIEPREIRELFAEVCDAPKYVFEKNNVHSVALRI